MEPTISTKQAPLGALAIGTLTAGTAVASTLASPAASSPWFVSLRKPPFQPPSWVFGPVWTGLYSAIAVAGYLTWRAPASSDRSAALALWGGQLGLNGAWSPLFFRLHQPKVALVDSVLLFATTAAYAARTRKVNRLAAWLMVPYLGWLAFATVLNAEIVRRNPAR